MQEIADKFSEPEIALSYFSLLRDKYPRYVRDHLQAISKSLSGVSQEAVDKTLAFCIKNQVINGNDWIHVLHVQAAKTIEIKSEDKIKLMGGDITQKADQKPQTSSLEDYEKIINS
ncbi:MAG: hypothetical protein GWN01_14000, partial [Nitrosopumilaceae archaeon]|nr:hypothetical protein [Nitrosopumilaceae archaeon]NIU88387.1 hypothetical protein [Nitrosopumilaceae archaeon]NIX62574.1 hypothetical protein [Nitrosopumilaceae archaeon]